MKKTRKIKNFWPNVLIFFGASILFNVVLYQIGFNFCVKVSTLIIMGFLPLNQELNAWVTFPIGFGIQANLTNVQTSSLTQLTNRTLGKGTISLQMKFTVESYPENSFPILWIQDDADIGEVLRHLILLSSGTMNYVKYFFRGMAALALVAAITAAVLRYKKRKELSESESVEQIVQSQWEQQEQEKLGPMITVPKIMDPTSELKEIQVVPIWTISVWRKRMLLYGYRSTRIEDESTGISLPRSARFRVGTPMDHNGSTHAHAFPHFMNGAPSTPIGTPPQPLFLSQSPNASNGMPNPDTDRTTHRNFFMTPPRFLTRQSSSRIRSERRIL